MSSPRRHTVITLLRAVHDAMVDELIARLHAAGHPDIRRAHSSVFENLDRDGTRLTVLADRAQMTHPSMSELVSAVERLGYVERVRDTADGRARVVCFTPAGRNLQRLALTETAEVEAAWLERLGPRVGAGLRTALLTALDTAEAEPSPEAVDPGGMAGR
ncbi:MarR family winged helix-turn-helix transcriptional regulator [Pseudonocardia parietis]|uniref:DNA-binding MarR family transcriptional regulator n=1 Tax=Pseudonocardia parietis TaxID=570936 RepID=A0ABS4VX63_9PSEU|nr:MarR family winged helix-turn-helix transcriptional regulator [Pseudonocardia parietis]MBP2368494.1 DNA-binding MarR family transcriptional regulator [Pseudonocardia parietis]